MKGPLKRQVSELSELSEMPECSRDIIFTNWVLFAESMKTNLANPLLVNGIYLQSFAEIELKLLICKFEFNFNN